MEFTFASQEFMLVSAAVGSVLFCVMCAVLKNNFRVGSPVSWIVLAILAPMPVAVAVPAAGLVALNTDAALPVVGMAVVVGLAWVHIVLPALVPDFQTDSFTASAIGAAAIGVAVFVGGVATNSFPQGYLLGDEQAVFQDRSAGALRDAGID